MLLGEDEVKTKMDSNYGVGVGVTFRCRWLKKSGWTV